MIFKQKTLKREASFKGKTLFTGQEVAVKIHPAPASSGIIFRRVDLPTQPTIAARTEQVCESIRCTKIRDGDHSVQTIEHFMAAVKAFDIDNMWVDISGPEMPILDGSALPFMKLFDQAGVIEQAEEKTIYTLDQPVSWSEGDMHFVALPADEFRVSYTLHYPQSPYLKSQYYSFAMNSADFKQEIAPCRTFTLFEQVAPLIEKGILKNANLDHGVVIHGEKVLNPEGARFPDEMVRHKILDIIGDFALIGYTFHAHLIAIKTGHAANHIVAKQILKCLRKK